jgi:tRNA dimethylallyltransferase
MNNDIVVITGPTATGKTKLSVMLAKQIGGEIINADSMQIYRGMDVGTAKPTLEEREGVPHHLFDVAEPDEPYSVSRYVAEADAAIDAVRSVGKIPIVVGGTLLYIDSLISGRTFADTNPELRTELSRLADPYSELQKVDPDSALKFHPNDKIRIIRALEVYRLTGKTIAEHNEETKRIPPKYRAVKIALDFIDRKILYSRIDKRVDNMVLCGLEDEVRNLGFVSKAIGYKEIAAAQRGECTREEAIAAVKKASRNYAKRQLTWLRQDLTARWIKWENEIDFERGLQVSTEIVNREMYNG